MLFLKLDEVVLSGRLVLLRGLDGAESTDRLSELALSV